MNELLSVPEAAKELHLHPSRVRALVAAGGLPAVRVGRQWVIERSALARRRPGLPGRPFAAQNAWAILFLASGWEVSWLDPTSHWRMRQALAHHRLEELLPRLGGRADALSYRAHPGELSYLLEDGALVRSGASAARHHKLKLVPGREVDAYVRSRDLEQIEAEYALGSVGIAESNVVLRVVPDGAWHFDPEERYAPLAAVALDLADDTSPRAQRAAEDAFRRLRRSL